jgi:hypothetical protein
MGILFREEFGITLIWISFASWGEQLARWFETNWEEIQHDVFNFVGQYGALVVLWELRSSMAHVLQKSIRATKTENTLRNSEVLFCLHVLEFSLNWWCLVGLHYGLLFGSSSSPTLLISRVLKKGTRNGKPSMGSQNRFQQLFFFTNKLFFTCYRGYGLRVKCYGLHAKG